MSIMRSLFLWGVFIRSLSLDSWLWNALKFGFQTLNRAVIRLMAALSPFFSLQPIQLTTLHPLHKSSSSVFSSCDQVHRLPSPFFAIYRRLTANSLDSTLSLSLALSLDFKDCSILLDVRLFDVRIPTIWILAEPVTLAIKNSESAGEASPTTG